MPTGDAIAGVENVTEETSNPFGMDVGGPAVYGYGDANADFQVVGDHPGRHGGVGTGVPFTGSVAGVRLQRVLHGVGFAAEPYADRPRLENCYVSYVHPGIPEGRDPTDDAYAAECRRAAEVLEPVHRPGEPLARLLEQYPGAESLLRQAAESANRCPPPSRRPRLPR